MSARWRSLRALVICLALILLFAAVAGAAPRLALGFFDEQFTGPGGAAWLQRAAAAGSDFVRIDIGWDAPNTPARPAGFDARNPADPHYDFTAADQAIRAAAADGMRVIASFTGAPEWAQGRGRPAYVSPGSWRPDPAAIEDYAVALGRRYSGHFPDPLNPGHVLPRAYAFQVWNEPNLDEYLTPQWDGDRAVAPGLYRNMLNAFYRGLKSVDPGALVVTAGTAPFGDFPGGNRIMPAAFWRDVLCVRQVGRSLRGTACRNPAHFDVLAHHPYSVGPPDTVALNPDDVSIPDIGKLTAILRAAERSGGALPRIRHPIWVTEVSYNTAPPNPQGVPVEQEAHWLDRTLRLLWSQGVSLIAWNTIVDQPPIPSYSATSQAGIYYIDGQPKPALDAFSFPTVAWRVGKSTVDVWGRSPQGGRLEVERRAGSGWRIAAVLDVSRRSVFFAHVRHTGAVTLRVRIGKLTSLGWNVK